NTFEIFKLRPDSPDPEQELQPPFAESTALSKGIYHLKFCFLAEISRDCIVPASYRLRTGYKGPAGPDFGAEAVAPFFTDPEGCPPAAAVESRNAETVQDIGFQRVDSAGI